MMPSAKAVRLVMQSKGYAVFDRESKGYNLNIFGVRSRNTDSNRFNDVVGVMYVHDGEWCCFLFPATTDPGVYWREHPMNVRGAAILAPGQYRGAYKLGQHKGYDALVQKKEVKVYRDGDKNYRLSMATSTIESGIFGINIHRANKSKASLKVNKWSAGCQVLADPYQFDFLMALVRKAVHLYGNSFTYTLLTAEDFE